MSIVIDGLAVLQQLRTDIAPGASGWRITGTSEENAINELIQASMKTLKMDPNSGLCVQVQNYLCRRIEEGIPGKSEKGANRGQINSVLIKLEKDLIAEISED